MQDFICVTGMILRQTPAGEYDRRICILTKERGKIAAFAKGARKPGSKMAAATNPFSFGIFKLYEGKNSYTVAEAEIQNYFETLRTDYISAYYGMYFAEMAEYCTRENNDEKEMLKLLYQSLRALCAPSLDNRLVKCVFEIKTVAVNGEFPGLKDLLVMIPDKKTGDSVTFTVDYIVNAPVEKLYTFTVKEEVLYRLEQLCEQLLARFLDRELKSLEILKTLC